MGIERRNPHLPSGLGLGVDPYDPFGGALHEGTLVRRYKRFLADVRLADGREVTAHCPNSGSMLGMRAPGSDVLLTHAPDPRRKLKWTWETVRPPNGSCWIGCNTSRPNRVVEEAVRRRLLPGVDPGQGIRREVRYGTNSRIDLLVGDVHVEVKNTTLAAPRGADDSDKAALDACALGTEGNTAYFPDAVTARGAKHMDELARVCQDGGQAMVVFLVNRGDCDRFAVARNIDPAYGQAFDRAVDAGVAMVPLGVGLTPGGWTYRGVLPHA